MASPVSAENPPVSSPWLIGPHDRALRYESFSAEHLGQYARELAAASEIAPPGIGDPQFIARFEKNAKLLRRAHQAIASSVQAGEPITPDAEWLLDNFYVVEEQLREVHDDLPRQYFLELPKLANGEPRVYRFAVELISHTDSALDEETVVRFVREFQSTTALSIGEVWAVPIMLRLGLIENLRRLASQMLTTRACRCRAGELLESWQPHEDLDIDLSSREGCAPLLLLVLEELEQRGPDFAAHARRIERQLADHNITSHELVRMEHQRQAANQVSIGNVITSMRLISALDWVIFFEKTNLAEEVLRDPAEVYAQMDFETRDRYRHVVEELAKRAKFSDMEIATRCVALAESVELTTEEIQRRHIGYYLIDRGRPAFEKSLGARATLWDRTGRWLLGQPNLVYLGGVAALTAAFTCLLTFAAWNVGSSTGIAAAIGLLALLPASELAVNLTNLFITRWIPPRRLPKLEFKQGVPATHAAAVVIPSLLSNPREVESLVQRLELHYLANQDRALRFALLTDFADAPRADMPDDDAVLQAAVAGIRELNARHGGAGYAPFYLFHRRRQWNEREQKWMGWERKRGKLMEFNRWLRGATDTSYIVVEGDLSALKGAGGMPPMRYVITLDADTQLPHGVARRLIGTLAHPLNRPRFDAAKQRIVDGYALLQPRISVNLGSANTTWFARVFANSPGIDPYATASSDVYQDLFGEGSFTGKGIYDVRAFEQVLMGVFPENAILSHDLIEGCHLRVGLVSDIELVDGYPSRYDVEARRAHRWVRGDWQLLPWLGRSVPTAKGHRRNPLSLLSRWKIFDNLRRSQVAPAVLLFLLAGWLAAPGGAWIWSLTAVLTLAFPAFTTLARIIGSWRTVTGWLQNRRAIGGDLARAALQGGLALAFLPHKAWLNFDAAARTIVRVLITKRRLLEWETAADAERRQSHAVGALLARMWFVPGIAVATGFFLAPAAWPWAGPFLLGWLISPGLAHFLSQPIRRRISTLSAEQGHWLRRTACKTWGFFEAVVDARGHWLPPDNLQEYPSEKIAYRVSPTNEGLFLVAALAARDFGFIPLLALGEMWEKNLAEWEKLDKLNGHFFNWYDTETLKPLHPRYVSAVDSGNLAACFLTLRQGIAGVQAAPIVGDENWRGLLDMVDVAEEACESLHPRGARIVNEPLENLTRAVQAIRRHGLQPPTDVAAWCLRVAEQQADAAVLSRRLEEFLTADEFPAFVVEPAIGQLVRLLNGLAADLDNLLPWAKSLLKACKPAGGERGDPRPRWKLADDRCRLAWEQLWHHLGKPPTLSDVAQLDRETAAPLDAFQEVCRSANLPVDELQEIETWLDELRAAIGAGAKAATEFHERLERLAAKMETLALEMDFRFLYNPQRKLFSIGFNVEDGKLDRSHYDMLASEARLASYLAIGKGDVEPRHWFQLGRLTTETAGRVAVLSWGGTMFEYMMPPLFQRTYEDSLLGQSQQAAVQRQMEYGRQHGVPWGISESAFGALAVNSDYHYRSFGVPGLGLKRGLAKDLVISPYSTMLALEADPVAAVENLQALAADGGLGRWGFYDAVDYSAERVPAGKRCIVVRCFMAHHHGMTMLALANLLRGGVMRARFHAHPLVRSTELLLQERMPWTTPRIQPNTDELEVVSVSREGDEFVCRRLTGVNTAAPRTHLLSNGRYSVMLTSTGAGYSQCRDLAISRWRPDATRDHWGQFIYLRERRTGRVWSAAYQPTCVQPDAYEVLYSIDKAEFHRRDGDLETRLEIAVSPENNAEVRQLTITNHGSEPREIEITSYAEVLLNKATDDLAHPAFHKLFVQTEYVAEEAALLAKRRPRDSLLPPTWGLHVLAATSDVCQTVRHETSREAFLGRGRDPQSPAAMAGDGSLSGATGAVLDPIFSLRCQVVVRPHESATVAFATAVAASREEALVLADQYHDPRGIQRAFELAWAYCQVDLRHLHLSSAKAHLFQRLAAGALYPDPACRAPQATLLANRQGQSALWRYGISGDRPLLVTHVTKPEHLQLVRDLVAAQGYWEKKGLRVDFAIVNDYPGSYLDALHEQLTGMLGELQRPAEERPPAIALLRGAQMPREDLVLIDAAAAILLNGDRGSLAQQVEALTAAPKSGLMQTPRLVDKSRMDKKREVAPPPSATRARDFGVQRLSSASPGTPPPAAVSSFDTNYDLEFWNGYGGFTRDRREYRIRVTAARTTPMPWSNVIANPRFGCLVTESGGGYTWFANSRENKLTTWANDPIGDPPAELLFLRDERTQEVLFPLPGAAHDANEYWVHHGQGYTRFVHHSSDLRQETLIAIADDDPVKVIKITLKNEGRSPRELSLTYYCEWVLGVCREQTQLHVHTSIDPATGALLARNPFHPEFSEQVAFLHVLGRDRTCTGDRGEFIGRNGDHLHPAAMAKDRLSGSTGAGLDPCGAVQAKAALAPGEQIEIVFLLGCGESPEEAAKLLEKYLQPARVTATIDKAVANWDAILGKLQVATPNPALDLLVNRWLLYQTLACRVWGRSAYYQAGGAYGFRDQLQDVMALVYSRPDLAREHLLRAAGRQYEEGDVQHWWHPPTGRGTRTRYSDDYLWLPLVACHYISVTGDASVLDEVVPFLHSMPLAAHEHERYETPAVSPQSGSLYEHCRHALARSAPRGPHGLPLMGCGDWNDGMNRVGELGQGESVWVGWFLCVILKRFIPVVKARGDQVLAAELQAQVDALRLSMEEQAWDGEWYRRAYFDDGLPLGSIKNDECQIDSISQSWAVMAGADPRRTGRAMDAVLKRLVRADEKIVLLFAPPFNKTTLDPGYIKGYLPGIRENGGQYTHSAVWVVQALTMLNDSRRANELFDMLLPIRHAATVKDAEQYRVEPYVVAADIYGVAPHVGRGGWTWYTGSAAWMYRTAIESILGFQLRGDRLLLTPCIPQDWPSYEIRYVYGRTTYQLNIINDAARSGISLDVAGSNGDANAGSTGSPFDGGLQLVDDGQVHRLIFHLPATRGTISSDTPQAKATTRNTE